MLFFFISYSSHTFPFTTVAMKEQVVSLDMYHFPDGTADSHGGVVMKTIQMRYILFNSFRLLVLDNSDWDHLKFVWLRKED